VDARNHNVEPIEQRIDLVERAVIEDVDLDSRKQAKAGGILIDLLDRFELVFEAVSTEAVRDPQSR